MRTFAEIIEVIKSQKHLAKDADVAELLKINSKTMATAKSRNSFPFEELASFCNEEGVSLNRLLSGEWVTEGGEEALKRVFFYNSIKLEDPDPKLSLEEVKKFWSSGYPELSQSEIEGPEITKTGILFKFVKKIGVKGSGGLAIAEPGSIYAVKDAQMNEIIEILKEHPGDKKLVLKLLKGKKDIKEALEGFGVKGLVEEG